MFSTRARLIALPLATLILGLLIALAAGIYTQRNNDKTANTAFEVAVRRTQNQLSERLHIYEAGLRGTRGFIIGTNGQPISHKHFSAYIESRDLHAEFPGARGFGFIRRVPVKDEAKFVAANRADGRPSFAIRQLQPNQDLERFIIQFLEPQTNNRAAIGLDIGSEPMRRTAALDAMHSGELAVTAPITLVQADGKKNNAVLILIAAYANGMPTNTEAQRAAATIGWAYAPLVLDEVLTDFDYLNESVALRVSDITQPRSPQRLYESADFPAQPDQDWLARSTLPIGERLWQVEVHALPTITELKNTPSPILVGGLFAAIPVALSALLFFVLQNNVRAAQIAAEQNQNRQLVEATALQHAIQKNAGYAIISTTIEGTITSFNPAAETLLGYSAAELVGKSSPAVFHDADEVIARAELLSRELGHEVPPGFGVFVAKTFGGEADSAEWTYIRKDGRRVPVWLTVSALQDERGRTFGFIGIAADLTKRKEADERFRRVVDAAPTPILIADMKGIILTANRAAARIFGYANDELLGLLVSDLVPQSMRAQHDGYVSGYIHHPTERQMGSGKSLKAQRKNGELFDVEVSLSPISLGQNTLIMALVFDVTERRAHEANLQTARQAAEDAARAKSDFLANMSHEIRTPMNAIMGLTQLALETELDERQSDYLRKVKTSSQALLGILNDILDFSKIEAGRLELESIEFRLDEAMENSANLFMLQAEQKGLEILIEIAPDVPLNVLGDSLRISQVLNNLIGNAIKFTEKGEIHASAKLLQTNEHDCLLSLSVRDTGMGLSPEQAAKLFQPFTQADASTTRKHGGTGLGLTICKRLVEMMGGEIGLSSIKGGGTTFTFTVRLGMGAGSSVEKDEATLQSIEGMRILVTDDNEATLTVLADILSNWKVATTCLNSGQAVLPRIKEAISQGHPYDLILLDWQMPGMDGVEVVACIEAEVAAGGISKAPTVMMATAYRRDELLTALGGRQVESILTKPLTPSHLLDALVNIRQPAAKVSRKKTALSADYQSIAAPLAGMHILLAEDNLLNQQVASAFLKKSGLQVTIAKDGREAVDLLLNPPESMPPFVAVLMDMQMPEMDGLEATQIIRTHAQFDPLPIIAMTANAMTQDRDACLAVGMNDHIAKPIVPRTMIETLLKWVPHIAPGEKAIAQTAGSLRTLSELDLAMLNEKTLQLGSELDSQRLKAKQLISPLEQLIDNTAFSVLFKPVADATRALRFKQARAHLTEFMRHIDTGGRS